MLTCYLSSFQSLHWAVRAKKEPMIEDNPDNRVDPSSESEMTTQEQCWGSTASSSDIINKGWCGEGGGGGNG